MGGKGIRVVNNQEKLIEVYDSVKSERSGEMILFRIIENARLVELQMARDKHNHTVCFGGRGCTIQRTHQKFIEESLILNQDLYDKLKKFRVKLMNEVNYVVGVATVEFIVSGKDYYFFEVDTRIQVEHPVTELKYN